MKKIRLWIILAAVGTAILATALTIILVVNHQKGNQEIKGITFESQTVMYDGLEHSLEITGELPKGVEVYYENNAKVDVGSYDVIARFKDTTGKYLVPEDMTAVLTITRASINVQLENKTVTYDGREQVLEITGELPKGVEVHYENNAHTDVGTYTVVATFTNGNNNYVPLSSLTATLTIEKADFDWEKVQFSDKNVVYNGKEQMLSVISELPRGIEIEYRNHIHTQAGSYEVEILVMDTLGNYNPIEVKTETFIIEKATYPVEGIQFSSVEIPYDGTTHYLEITGDLPEGLNAVYENNARKELGQITATVSFQGDFVNYNVVPSMSATLTIVRGTIHTITFEDTVYTYDGNPKQIEYKGDLPEGIQVSYEGNGRIYAGTYKVVAHFTDERENYYPLTLEAMLTIEKAEYDLSGMSFEDERIVYDGNPHSLVIRGTLPQGVQVSYSENTLTSVGKLIVTASFKIEDEENYHLIPDKTAVLTILPAELEGVSLESKTFAWDGEIHGLTLTGELPEGITFEYINNYQKEIGEYEVTVHFSVENYKDLTATLTIEKAHYNMNYIYFHNQTFTYDGTVHRLELTGTLPQGVSVIYENNTLTDVGEKIAIARFIIEDEEHYELIEAKTALLKVIESEIQGISFGDGTYTYNQKEHFIYIQGTLPEGVSVEYKNNGKVNAGIYTVSAHFIDSTGNYTVPEDMEAKLEILKADFAKSGIVFLDREFTYDKTVHSLELYCEDLPDDILVVYDNNSKINAGTYTVTASFIDEGGNYNPVAPVSAKMIIHKAKINMDGIVFENEFYEYDGKKHALVIHGELPEGVTVSYTLNTLVGYGRLEVTATFIVDEENYEKIESKTAVLTITKGTLEGITFEDLEITYDGKPHSLFISGTLPDGVVVTYSNNRQINAGEYLVTAEFNDSVGYYNSMTAKLTIKKAVYDMSDIRFENQTHEYDGTEYSLEISGELPEGVEVVYTKNNLTNAGSITVIASFKGNENYESIENKTAILTIKKAKLQNVKFEDDSVEYDTRMHGIYVTGLPEEIRVIYFQNEGIDAGTYKATATFIVTENYETMEDMTATLTITKRRLDPILLEDKNFVLDGMAHSLTIDEELPLGVYAVYENNNQMYEGEYIVKCTLFSETDNYVLPEPVYAKMTIYSDNTYHSVYFYLDDEETEIRIVPHGEGIDVLPTPKEHSGYTASWTYDFTTITGKMECYPTYTPKVYTLTFDTGTDEVFEDVTVTFDTEIVLPIPSKEGYTFEKWIDENKKEVSSGIYKIPSNLTLYAVWKCSVSYKNVNGYLYEEDLLGSGEYTSPKKQYSSNLAGWYTDKEFKNRFDFTTVVESNLTLYAKYEYDYLYEITEEQEARVLEILNKEKEEYDFTAIEDVYPITFIEDGILNGCSNLKKLSIRFLKENATFGSLFGTAEYENAVAVEQGESVYYLPQGLDRITISNTHIPHSAFYNCTMLKQINLVDTEVVGGYAFYNCNQLETIHLQGNITTIHSSAFGNCEHLQAVYTESLEQWCEIEFEDASANPMAYASQFYEQSEENEVKEIELSGVTQVKNYQFYGFNGITRICIPNAISIGIEAFGLCEGLESIEIGKALQTVYNNAFNECNRLVSVYYNGTMDDWCQISFENERSTPMAYADSFYRVEDGTETFVENIVISPVVLEIGNYQFYGFSQIKNVQITSELTEIGNSAFAECEQLETIHLPQTVHTIAARAFLNCKKLNHVIYDGTIKDWAQIEFRGRESTPMIYNATITFTSPVDFEHIVLDDLTEIGNYQFYGFKEMKNITLSNILTGIGNSAFYNCSQLTELTLGTASVVKIQTNAFYNCNALEFVYYTQTLEQWQNIQFADMTSTPLNSNGKIRIEDAEVENVILEESLGSYQFYGFTDLKTISFGSNVKTIGRGAFAHCTSLERIELADSIQTLGVNCFEGDTALKYVKIGDGIKTISESCFRGCTLLETVEWTQVTKIGNSAFNGCIRLSDIRLSSIEELGESAFAGCSTLAKAELSALKVLNMNSFMNCSNLTEVILSNQLIIIYGSAFNGCVALEEIVIPASVTTISNMAFMGCRTLRLYASVSEKPAGWSSAWNQGTKDVYWYSETAPTTEGLYWHYVNDVIEIWN